jgi:hypothetical protein
LTVSWKIACDSVSILLTSAKSDSYLKILGMVTFATLIPSISFLLVRFVLSRMINLEAILAVGGAIDGGV